MKANAPEHQDVDDCKHDIGAPAQNFVALACQSDRNKP